MRGGPTASSAALLRIAAVVSTLPRAPLLTRADARLLLGRARGHAAATEGQYSAAVLEHCTLANDGYLRPQLVRDGDTATGTHVFSAVEAGFYKRTELRREREKRRDREEAKERREGESLLDQKRKGLTA